MIEFAGALLLLALLGRSGSEAEEALEGVLHLSREKHRFYVVFAIHRSDLPLSPDEIRSTMGFPDSYAVGKAPSNVAARPPQAVEPWAFLKMKLDMALSLPFRFPGYWDVEIELLPGLLTDDAGIGDPADRRFWLAAIFKLQPRRKEGDREPLRRDLTADLTGALWGPNFNIPAMYTVVGVDAAHLPADEIFTESHRTELASRRLLGLLPPKGTFQSPREFGDTPPDLLEDCDGLYLLWREKWDILVRGLGRTEGIL